MAKIIGEDLIVKIEKVIPNTWNPKESIEESEENKKSYEAIKKEIENKGLFEAITVREKGEGFEILDGFHRWTACEELGFEEIRINNLGDISEDLARAITVIKEQKKVNLSEIKVAEIVNWFGEEGIEDDLAMEMLGYNEEQLEEYKNLFNFDWEEYKVEIKEGDDEVDEEVRDDEIIKERKMILRVNTEDYAKLRMRHEELGDKEFIKSLI